MRKIVIDSTIEGYADEYYAELKAKSIISRIESALDDLVSEVQDTKDGRYAKFLNHIKANLETIIKKHPKDYQSLIDEFEKFHCSLRMKKWHPKNKLSFAERIVDALSYKSIRKSIFPKYIKKLQIKTCVYCNTQYAITTGEDSDMSAYYELDHAWPKAEYPFLAISFFNLQPCCGPCNKRKSNTGQPYTIYAEQPTPSSVNFRIDEASLALYDMSHNENDLKIKLSVQDSNLELLYNRIGVPNLYSKLNDEAEELVWKKKIYNHSYIRQLTNTYNNIFRRYSIDFYRLLFGMYIEEENVYARPLTKMKQDIARQLNLIR